MQKFDFFFKKIILSHLKNPSLHSRNNFHDYMPAQIVVTLLTYFCCTSWVCFLIDLLIKWRSALSEAVWLSTICGEKTVLIRRSFQFFLIPHLSLWGRCHHFFWYAPFWERAQHKAYNFIIPCKFADFCKIST